MSTPIPEWDGMVLPVRIEENARLTDSGVKYFVPRQTELLVIGGGAVGNAICTGSDSRFAPLRGRCRPEVVAFPCLRHPQPRTALRAFAPLRGAVPV